VHSGKYISASSMLPNILSTSGSGTIVGTATSNESLQFYTLYTDIVYLVVFLLLPHRRRNRIHRLWRQDRYLFRPLLGIPTLVHLFKPYLFGGDDIPQCQPSLHESTSPLSVAYNYEARVRNGTDVCRHQDVTLRILGCDCFYPVFHVQHDQVCRK
jgi:hypothetical protein